MTRWVAYVVCAAAIGALSQTQGPSVWSLALAVVALVAFVVVCGSFGAFRRETWLGDEETCARCARIDQELEAEGR